MTAPRTKGKLFPKPQGTGRHEKESTIIVKQQTDSLPLCSQSRREFLKRSAAAAGTALGGMPLIAARAENGAKRVFKIALIGCGGRGRGALGQHFQAAKYLNDKFNLALELQVVALADWSQKKAANLGKRYNVPPERCFGGPFAYRKVLEMNPDTVLIATPPVFRPLHFEAAIQAGKHVFFEKPVAVDPPGVRRIMAAGELATKKGLCAVAGTQRRHQQGYNEGARAIKDGVRGRIMGGRVSWCMGKIFSNTPLHPQGPDDLVSAGKWQLWVEMSGDHIVEQHVHNIDIANWYLAEQSGGGEDNTAHSCTHPVSAVGFGLRARRIAGNMYDFFSIDFEYPHYIHIHSTCRQIGGCWRWVGEYFTYEKDRPNDYKPQSPDPYAEVGYPGNGYVSEHAHLLYAIVKDRPLNEARNVAWATGAAIMGRESAYTGEQIHWVEMFEDPEANPRFYNLQLKPTAEDFETGDITLLKDGDIRLPGKA